MTTANAVTSADEPEVLTSVNVGVGRIELNRPKAINALSLPMLTAIHQTLREWREDEKVTSVEFSGRGLRGFCSGADVRWLRTDVLDDPALGDEFFAVEYPLNADIATYPKPISALMDGITMGGGMGLTLHTNRRIGTTTTQLAMPEVTIGLFPDVGATFELSRMPGETGTWMAMTGASVDASSALWAGLLDETDELATHPDDSWLATAQGWIDECFLGNDPVAIITRLEAHDHPDARAAGELIRTKAPLSVTAALELVRRAAQLPDVAAVLGVDAVLARNFIRRPDFAEGVRAQLVDKDKSPTWSHQRLEDVSVAEVQAMFTAPSADELVAQAETS